MSNFIEAVDNVIWSAPLLVVLLLAGLYFTFRTRLLQIRMIPEMIKRMFEKSEEGGTGISSFQALTVALSGRVGTGNIAGVATAIAFGGPGAIFWMWLLAFIGAGSAFVETTLGQIFKREGHNGAFRGGPAYYIEKGLKHKPFAMVVAGIIAFAFFFLMPGIQMNGISSSMNDAFDIPKKITSLVACAILFIIIVGGIKRIAHIAEVVVPIMAIVYIILAFIVLVVNHDQIIPVVVLIFKSAFGAKPLFSGILGSTILYGVKRGSYSNEAGQGSQVAAAAAARVTHPVKQGLVQSFSVYIDTLLVCSATAFMILTTKSYNVYDANGHALVEHIKNVTPDNAGSLYTQTALNSVLGNIGGIFVAIALVFFAFTTLMSYYYIGETNATYLANGRLKRVYLLILQLLMLAGLYYCGVSSSQMVWNLGDIAVGTTVWVNIIVIVLLSPIVIKALKDYEKQLKAGKNPDFDPLELDIANADFWEKRAKNKKRKKEM